MEICLENKVFRVELTHTHTHTHTHTPSQTDSEFYLHFQCDTGLAKSDRAGRHMFFLLFSSFGHPSQLTY